MGSTRHYFCRYDIAHESHYDSNSRCDREIVFGGDVALGRLSPQTPCQRIYFANHTSHLDALILWASLPRQIRALTRPVAAKDYWVRGPIRRYMASVFDVLLIDREKIKVHNSPIDLMLNEIKDTHSLIVFPEGSRNTDEVMREFKSGLYYLSKKTAGFGVGAGVFE